MERFLQIIHWIFYILAGACIVFYAIGRFSNPVNDDFLHYAFYCGLCAIGISILRIVLKRMY